MGRHQRAKATSTNPITLSGGLKRCGKLDGTAETTEFAETPERVRVETVERAR